MCSPPVSPPQTAAGLPIHSARVAARRSIDLHSPGQGPRSDTVATPSGRAQAVSPQGTLCGFHGERARPSTVCPVHSARWASVQSGMTVLIFHSSRVSGLPPEGSPHAEVTQTPWVAFPLWAAPARPPSRKGLHLRILNTPPRAPSGLGHQKRPSAHS